MDVVNVNAVKPLISCIVRVKRTHMDENAAAEIEEGCWCSRGA
jgi:hypothetical protein